MPDELADTDVFVNVDVFGTIRSRTELHLYNAETLKAQTKFEYFAVDRRSKRIVSEPKTSAYEASYRENYALWTGPYKIQKTVKPADGLMVDFSAITPYGRPLSRSRSGGRKTGTSNDGSRCRYRIAGRWRNAPQTPAGPPLTPNP